MVLDGLVGALIGALLAASLGYWFSVRLTKTERRAQATLALITEFNSQSMLDARITAWKSLANQARRATPDDELSRVLHFFDTLLALYNADMLDRPLTRRVFAEVVKEWDTNYLAPDKTGRLRANKEFMTVFGSLRELREALAETPAASKPLEGRRGAAVAALTLCGGMALGVAVGVTALVVEAADPSMSANEVEAALLRDLRRADPNVDATACDARPGSNGREFVCTIEGPAGALMSSDYLVTVHAARIEHRRRDRSL